MSYLVFENQGQLSVLDLISMGDSIKVNDSSKIGRFDSGLKYAVAILLRNNVEFFITTKDHIFKAITTVLEDSDTGKSKEVITILKEEVATGLISSHVTGFSPKLGIDWEFWMAIREIHCNCLDEGGSNYSCEELPDIKGNYTRVIITINNDIEKVLLDWDNYFLNESLVEEYGHLEIHDNELSHLKLYKQGILVYEDRNKKSMYSYNFKNIVIDEMRRASLTSATERDIRDALAYSENTTLITELCTTGTKYFESKLDWDFAHFSDIWIETVNEIYSENQLNASENILKRLSATNGVNIGRKNLRIPNSNYCWETTKVEIVKNVDVENIDLSFDKSILKILSKYKLSTDFTIVESVITGYKVIADTNNKVLYINRDFTESDVWEAVRAIYSIERKSVDDLYKELTNLLKIN